MADELPLDAGGEQDETLFSRLEPGDGDDRSGG
jgi:hypothetical protein